jgi:hypothetical protein
MSYCLHVLYYNLLFENENTQKKQQTTIHKSEIDLNVF